MEKFNGEAMKIKFSDAISKLPPYLFAEISKKIAEKKKQGKDIIDFGIGDPDLPTPNNIVKALQEAALKPENHRYPDYEGKLELRQAIADFYKKKWRVDLQPNQIIVCLGAKEAVHNAVFAFGKGVALIPNPRYPVYFSGAIFSGREVEELPLLEENEFLPDLNNVKKLNYAYLWLNYPNNPTAAIGDKIIKQAMDFCRDHNIPLLYDNAYSEMTFNGYKAPTPLKEAMDITVEFHSFSKTYSMTGWRIGWMTGNKELIDAICKVKTNVDSGVPNMIQDAAIEALRGPQDQVKENMEMFGERRKILVEGLRKLGFRCPLPKATLYVWQPVPEEFKKFDSPSMEFATHLLEKVNIVVTPGVGFGKYGEGFVRYSITQPKERIQEALERIKKI